LGSRSLDRVSGRLYPGCVKLIPLVVLVLVAVPVGVFAVGRSSTGPCYHSMLPTPAQQLAVWKAAHAGSICTGVQNTITCDASDGSVFSMTTKLLRYRPPVCLPKNTPPRSVINHILNDLRQ
jgi:hypothetical protein